MILERKSLTLFKLIKMKKVFLLLASLLSIYVFSDRLDFSELVKKQSNSVVNIQATRKVYSNRSSMGSFPNDIFREFGFPLPEFEEPRRLSLIHI